MKSQSNNAIRLLVLFSVLFFTPLFFGSGAAMSAVVVDINRADTATMIANWKGIGEKKAKAIVAYRKKNGPFADINDLANVKGIGEGLIKNNRKYMSVKGGIKATSKTTTKKTDTKKSSTAKKSTSATKSTADKSAAKKSTSRNSTTKKSTSKKSTSKKSSSKKSKPKKSSTKKSSSKKPCTSTSSKADCKKKSK